MSEMLSYIPEVIQAHFDEAAFLYSEFLVETHSAKPNIVYISDVKERLDANLDGLLVNFKAAWTLCEEALTEDDAGAFFTTAYLAFHSGELDKVKPIVEAGALASGLLLAVSYGLAWHPWVKSGFWAEKFVAAKQSAIVSIGLFCFDKHQQMAPVNYSSVLERTLSVGDHPSTMNLLSLIRKNKDDSVLSVVKNYHTESLEETYFEVLKTRVALKDMSAFDSLKPFVMTDNDYREQAIEIVFPVLEKQQAKQWVAELKCLPEPERWMLLAIAELNEKALIPWVVSQMESPKLSRIAGHAFCKLTGFDLRQKGWSLDDELLDSDWLHFDGDEELDWPDVAKIKQAMSL